MRLSKNPCVRSSYLPARLAASRPARSPLTPAAARRQGVTMIVDDIDEDDIVDAPAVALAGQQPTPVAAQLELPSPAGQAAGPQPPPEPEIELTPAASAAELEEQVAELMGRDRQGAINMVRAVLCRCTPAEFEQIDVRALEAEAKRLQLEVKRQEKEAEKNAKRLAKIAEDEARRLQREADQEAKARQRLELAAQKKRQKLTQTVRVRLGLG